MKFEIVIVAPAVAEVVVFVGELGGNVALAPELVLELQAAVSDAIAIANEHRTIQDRDNKGEPFRSGGREVLRTCSRPQMRAPRCGA
jgi:hypothetical protein